MVDANTWTAVITAGAVVLAVSAIWVKGVKPTIQWGAGFVVTLRELVDLVREVRDFFMKERDEMRATQADHDTRISSLEAARARKGDA